MPDYRSMPTDLDELYADLGSADDQGNTQAAAVIATRIRMVKSAQADQYDPDRDESGLSKAAIGAGRGLMDLGQGLKQKWLMATDPEEAQRYTDRMNAEVARFESDFPGIGAESFGRFAGWALPALVVPGGAVGAIAGGALEGAIMPTASADPREALKQAAVGATIGAAFKGAPGAYRAIKDRLPGRTPVPATPELQEAAEFAAEQGFKMRPQHLDPNGVTRTLGNMADSAVFGDATESTLKEARTLAEKLQRYKQTNLQASVQAQKKVLKAQEKKVWDGVMDQVGDAPFNQARIKGSIEGVIANMRKSGGMGKEVEEMEFLLENLPEGNTLRDLKNFRSAFASSRQAAWAKEGMATGPLKSVYAQVSDEMMRVAEAAQPGGAALMQGAVDATKSRIRTQKTAGLARDVFNNQIDRESAVRRIAMGNDPQRASALKDLMTAEGVDGVRYEIADQIITAGLQGQRIFGAGSAASATRKLGTAIDTFMSPDQAAELKGFMRLMDSIKGETAVAANLPTGKQALGVAGVMFPAAVGVANPLAGAITAVVNQGLIPVLMRRRDVTAMLQKLSKEKSGSPLARKLTEELTSVMGDIVRQGTVGAAVNEPMRIEIRQ